MKGVKYGDYHTYDEFSLILTGKNLSTPSVKQYVVQLDGADGVLDLTEYFGRINYENRKLTCTFETDLRGQEYYDTFDDLINKLQGRTMQIHLDEDPYFYLEGRIKINEFKSNEKIGKVVIEAECKPYKFENIITRNEFVVNGTEKEIVLRNLTRKTEVEIEVITSSNISVEYKDTTYSLGSGNYISDFLLDEGNNVLKINGNGTIAFNFRRGKL